MKRILTKRKAIAAAALLVLILAASHSMATSLHSSRIETAPTSKTTKTPATKNEAVKSPEKASQTPAPEVAAAEPTPQPVVDPNGCEAQGMHYRADNNECIPNSVTAAPATVAQPAVATTSGVEQWRSLVASYFGSETDTALAVMQCESGGNAAAHSPTNDYGLMQINGVHADMVGGNLAALYDPATNIRVAKQVRDGSGWGAWTCAR